MRRAAAGTYNESILQRPAIFKPEASVQTVDSSFAFSCSHGSVNDCLWVHLEFAFEAMRYNQSTNHRNYGLKNHQDSVSSKPVSIFRRFRS